MGFAESSDRATRPSSTDQSETPPAHPFQGASDQEMKIAATADLHFSPANQAALRDQLSNVRDQADVLVLPGISPTTVNLRRWNHSSMFLSACEYPPSLSWATTILRAGKNKS